MQLASPCPPVRITAQDNYSTIPTDPLARLKELKAKDADKRYLALEDRVHAQFNSMVKKGEQKTTGQLNLSDRLDPRKALPIECTTPSNTQGRKPMVTFVTAPQGSHSNFDY